MSPRQQSKGVCVFCGHDMTSGGLIRHLKTCDRRREAIEAANRNKKSGQKQRLYHLQIRNAWSSDFWLHLEINGNATLGELDGYLRAIWLECCGHLSQFTVGQERWGTEISMSRKMEQTLEPGLELTHIYDFGTSTETVIKAVDAREGYPSSKHPIYLMARNNMPEVECDICGEPARWLCEDYTDDYGEWMVLCDEHVAEYSDEDYSEPFEIVNSPRLGVCGYVGPAEPPY